VKQRRPWPTPRTPTEPLPTDRHSPRALSPPVRNTPQFISSSSALSTYHADPTCHQAGASSRARYLGCPRWLTRLSSVRPRQEASSLRGHRHTRPSTIKANANQLARPSPTQIARPLFIPPDGTRKGVESTLQSPSSRQYRDLASLFLGRVLFTHLRHSIRV
jgi:hypothetical protein